MSPNFRDYVILIFEIKSKEDLICYGATFYLDKKCSNLSSLLIFPLSQLDYDNDEDKVSSRKKTFEPQIYTCG